MVDQGAVSIALEPAVNVFVRPDASTREIGPKIGGASMQEPADRLLPSAKGPRPVVQPQNDESVRHGDYQMVTVSKVPTDIPVQSAAPTAESQLEFRLATEEIAARLTFAQARAAAFQQQIERFAGYNQFASPNTMSMLPANVFPGGRSYAPVTVISPIWLTGPVASYSPRSTFSHVLYESQQQLRDAQLEVQALEATQQRLTANGPVAPEPGSAPRRPSYEVQLQEIDAQLELEQFRAESAGRREQQFDNWVVAGGLRARSANPLQANTASPFSSTDLSRFTHLSELSNLGLGAQLESKIRLQRLEHELRAKTLQSQRELIRDYVTTSPQRARDAEKAAERPKVQSPHQWTATTSK